MIGYHEFTCSIQDYLDELGYVPLDSKMPSTAKCKHCNIKFNMETKIMEIKFRGIDSFNQPIYKAVDKKFYLGTNEKLFSLNECKEVVDKYFQDENNLKKLIYFGSSFDCEPEGLSLNKNIQLKII